MPNSNSEVNETPPPSKEVLFQESYDALLPKFLALGPGEIAQINLDIPAAVSTAMGVAREIRALEARAAEELPRFDFEPIRRLSQYALALSHANTAYLMACAPDDALVPLVEEGARLREILFNDATALVTRRVLNGNQLRDLPGPVGYRNLAGDLQILSKLFHDHWADVEGKSAVRQEEVHRAVQIAAEILRTVGEREQNPVTIAATADMRARAFTVFMQAYGQARRLVTYLHWNDLEESTLAPSLYAGRSNGRRKHGPDATAPGHGPDAPHAPAATPAPPAVVPVAAPANGHAPAPAPRGAIGTPSAEPFVS